MCGKDSHGLNEEQPEKGLLSRLAIGALWLYQRTLSPAFYAIGVRCRHEPTCSHYAMEAYRRHGSWRGSWLTFSRLYRCHPFGSHGFDPVPEKLERHGLQPWKYGDWAWTERDGPRPSP